MSAISMTTTTTTTTTATTQQFVFPLPAASLPNGHLTWDAYLAWQAHHLTDAPVSAPAVDTSESLERYLSTPIMPRCVWLQPATYPPNAQITWTEWTARQIQQPDVQHIESVRAARAA